MRITDRMLHQNFLNNLDKNKAYLERIQDKLSSGKTVNRPSDNPIVVSRVMSLRTSFQEMEQYDRNMEDANSWLDASEAALNNLNHVLQRAREQAVYGAGGTLPPEAMRSISEEVNQLVKETVQVANTVFGDSYIFGGTHTTEPPFVLHEDDNGRVLSVEYIGDLSELNYEVAPGVKIAINASGLGFGLTEQGEDDDKEVASAVFDALLNLRDLLDTGDGKLVGDSIGAFDKVIDDVLSERASLGARSNRMFIALERSKNTQLEFTKMISRLEDIDLPRETIDFRVQQATYAAALKTGAQILQPSLLDFLR